MEDPTPIRIRGKKRNRDLVNAHQSQITHATAKRARTLATSLTFRQMEYQAATPTLQGLPQELLEIIFLHSMNIALPRASPDLGRKLSSRYVTMEYTMRTFIHSREAEPLEPGNFFEHQFVSHNKDAQLQVLACRFFTYSFFRDYVQRAHEVVSKLAAGTWMADREIPGLDHFAGLLPYEIRRVYCMTFADQFLIPEKLLHGPWTEDEANFLYVLTSIGGRVDLIHTMAGETLKEGLTEAVADGNERAVAALAVLLGVNRRLTTEMLRHAVLECGCDFNILRHLLYNAQMLYDTTPRDQLNLHDPVLWQWADDKGGEEGELLKDLLRRAEKCCLTVEVGTAGVHFPYSRFKTYTKTITPKEVGHSYPEYGQVNHLHI